MLNNKVTEALNSQINKEIYSAYLYLAMSAYSESKGLKGFANWLYVQYQEETTHAMKIYNYILEQGDMVELRAVEKPPKEFGTPLEMFEQVLAHEQMVTRSINELVDLAIKEKDHATQIMLQWFVTEQIEEEANDNEIIDQLKLAGKEGGALFMIDKELATRVFVDETQQE